MRLGLEEGKLEVLLKTAIIQYSINELEDYSPQEEIDKLLISDACDYRLRKMIRRFWQRQWLKKGLKIVKRSVAVITMTAGVSFIILIQFKEVRTACYNILVQVANRYIRFDYKASNGEMEVIYDGKYSACRKDKNGDGLNLLIWHNGKDEIQKTANNIR